MTPQFTFLLDILFDCEFSIEHQSMIVSLPGTWGAVSAVGDHLVTYHASPARIVSVVRSSVRQNSQPGQ